MALLRRCSLVLILIATAAATASAQIVIDQVSRIYDPYEIVHGAETQLPDGRIYGFYKGGVNGAIFMVTGNAASGFTTTIVHEFGETETGPPRPYEAGGYQIEVVEAGPDGKIYFHGLRLSRFDPATNTVEDVAMVASIGFPTSLSMGIDGHTLYGTYLEGRIYTYDTATGIALDGPYMGYGVMGVLQIGNGDLLLTRYQFDGYANIASSNLIDASTGWFRPNSSGYYNGLAPRPTRGDDGTVYAELSYFGATYLYRFGPGCYCNNDLVMANAPVAKSFAGPRNGYLYLSVDDVPHRLNLATHALELLNGQPSGLYQMLPDGTMLLGALGALYGLDTNTAAPLTTQIFVMSPRPTDIRSNGLPYYLTAGADGMIYSVPYFTLSASISIFRIDPATRVTEIAATMDFGGSQVFVGSPMVLASDGMMYGPFSADATSGIFQFDPVANTTKLVRTFARNAPLGGPHDLAIGSDGWIYGFLIDQTTYVTIFFRLDPISGALETPYRTDDYFYPTRSMIETSPGVWYGVSAGDQSYEFCGELYRFDAAAGTRTTVKAFNMFVDGCDTRGLALTPDGQLLITVAYGGPNSDYDRWFVENGSVYRFDLATNTLSMLHAFESELTGQPTRIWIGADGMAYGTLDFVDGIYTTAFFRLNPVTGETTILGDLRELLTFNALAVVVPGADGRIYGSVPFYFADQGVLAIGLAPALTVAPASGPFGGTATLSATIKTTGVPIPGVTVTFTLNGAAVGSATTDGDGVARLGSVSLNGIAIGTHAIAASFAGDDRFPSASGSGSLTVIEVPRSGLMMGDGFVRIDDRKHDVRFVVSKDDDGVDRGDFELRRKNKQPKIADDRFVAGSFSRVRFGDATVVFAGNGEWNGRSGYRFEAFAQDRGEGAGYRDALKVTIFDGAGNIVVTFDRDLDGGNIQVGRLR